MQDNPLTDKVALITGGARRIGREIACRLHNEGMRIMIHYRSSGEDANALLSELNASRSDSAASVQGDLTDAAAPEQIILETVHKFGRLDALINNASTFYSTPVNDATEQQWDDLMAINLKAPFFLSQAAASLLDEYHGCIVNIVDIYGRRPLKSHPIYCAAKAGLIMLTRALARDLAPTVRVNAIAPGAILWPENYADEVSQQRIIARTPLKRMGSPTEIAAAVVFLIRDASFSSGQVISVDGGRCVVP
jgi:pteridine reductase